MIEHPNIEKILENICREARINYDKTLKSKKTNIYWGTRYSTAYQIYQIYTGKSLDNKVLK